MGDFALPDTEAMIKSEIVDPECNMASTGTLLMVTNVVEFICHTIVSVTTTSAWANNWDGLWPAPMSL